MISMASCSPTEAHVGGVVYLTVNCILMIVACKCEGFNDHYQIGKYSATTRTDGV